MEQAEGRPHFRGVAQLRRGGYYGVLDSREELGQGAGKFSNSLEMAGHDSK